MLNIDEIESLGAALERRGIRVLGSRKGYARTHQVMADVRRFGGGLDVAQTNKNLLPDDTPKDWDRPSGLRMGTIEVTHYGMGEKEMEIIIF